MTHRLRRTAGRAAAAALAAAAVGLSGPAAWANGTNAGLALIVNPSNTTQNVNSGGSSTSWTIKLPSGAACSGDTAGQQYHVYSYIAEVTANPDPGALTFDSNGPIGNGTVYPLYDASSNAYINAATAITSGAVQNIPTFNFSLYSIDGRTTPANPDGTLTLPAGTYNVGVACAHADGTGDKYWNTQVVFSPSGTDVNGEVWQTQPNPQVPEFPLSIVLPVSAAAVLGAGFVLSRRRRAKGAVAAAG